MQKMTVTLTILFAVSLFAIYADDWPVWRGPSADGISAETGWNAAGIKKQLWQKEVGVGYSSVAVAGKYLYTMGNNGKEDVVYCFNAETGDEKWRFSYTCPPGKGYPGPRATPVVKNGAVYTLSAEGDLHALNAENGRKIWMKNIGSEGGKNIRWRYSGSPLVEDGIVVINAGARGMAFDVKSGKELWKSSGEGGYATPVLFVSKGKKYVLIFGKDRLVAVNLQDGTEVASYPWKTKYNINAADPIVSGSRIFISSGYGRGAALLEFKDGKFNKLWENKIMCAHISTPVLYKGYLYGASGKTGKGKFLCVSFEDGSEKWSNAAALYGSLIIADGKIIYLNERGKVLIGKVSPEAFKVDVSGDILKGSGKCWTMPVLADKRLYCRSSKGRLVCLDMR